MRSGIVAKDARVSEIEIFTYNGGPERWGDDWFYERWRTGLRTHALAR